MKLKNIKFLSVTVAMSAVVFSGCLKDDAFDNHEIQSVAPDGAQNAVYIGLTATSNSNHLQLAFEKSDVDTTFDAIPVQIAGGEATEDIQVTLAYDPAILGDYNTANGTTHEEAPTSLYTVTNTGDSINGYVVTIPKGSSTGYLQIKLKPNDFLGFDYALGMKIVSVSKGYLISSNFNTGILAIGVKNEWDGIYSYKGFTLRAGDNTLTGYFSGKQMALITKGATSVGFGGYALWGDGASGIAIGFPVLNLDLTSGPPYPVTITSDGGAYNDPGYNSRYDPDTKTFYISYTWGAGPASRLSTDTLTYVGPR
ncbi:MAG: DUF1735 domain-containing protein [Bacteroidetes bacterium]|nr:DUF1735 domain-containing protein [Bacteroidota bacterium]